MYASKPSLFVWLYLLIFVGWHAHSYADCASPAACNSSGSSKYRSGQYHDAISDFEKQVDFATGSNDQRSLRTGLNNLTLAYLKSGHPLQAHTWSKVAMGKFNDKATLHNAELVRIQLASLPLPRTAAGTYRKYAGYGQWSKLTLLPRAHRQFDLELSEMRYGLVPSAAEYGPAAVWNLDASAVLQGQALVVTYPGEDAVACHFTAQVAALSIAIEHQELSPSCLTGGYNTFPSGVFWRVEPQ